MCPASKHKKGQKLGLRHPIMGGMPTISQKFAVRPKKTPPGLTQFPNYEGKNPGD